MLTQRPEFSAEEKKMALSPKDICILFLALAFEKFASLTEIKQTPDIDDLFDGVNYFNSGSTGLTLR